MRRLQCATTILAAAVLAAGGAMGAEKKSESPPVAAASLEGIWSVVSMQDNGQKLPSSAAKTLRFEFTDKKLTMRVLEQVIAETEYTVDAKKTPKAIDVTYEGKPTSGIYQLDRDDLKICLGRSAGKRPIKFTSGADSPSRVLVVLKRGDLGPVGRQFVVMGIDGTGLRTLANFPKDLETGSPDWSPNGKQIAFDAWRLAQGETGPSGTHPRGQRGWHGVQRPDGGSHAQLVARRQATDLLPLHLQRRPRRLGHECGRIGPEAHRWPSLGV